MNTNETDGAEPPPLTADTLIAALTLIYLDAGLDGERAWRSAMADYADLRREAA